LTQESALRETVKFVKYYEHASAFLGYALPPSPGVARQVRSEIVLGFVKLARSYVWYSLAVPRSFPPPPQVPPSSPSFSTFIVSCPAWHAKRDFPLSSLRLHGFFKSQRIEFPPFFLPVFLRTFSQPRHLFAGLTSHYRVQEWRCF